MGKGSTSEQAQHCYRSISITLAGEYGLAQGAAAKEGSCQPNQKHTQEVPQVVVMSHWLAAKAPMVESGGEVAQGIVSNQGTDEEGSNATEKISIPDHDNVSPAADKAHPGLLRQETNSMSNQE